MNQINDCIISCWQSLVSPNKQSTYRQQQGHSCGRRKNCKWEQSSHHQDKVSIAGNWWWKWSRCGLEQANSRRAGRAEPGSHSTPSEMLTAHSQPAAGKASFFPLSLFPPNRLKDFAKPMLEQQFRTSSSGSNISQVTSRWLKTFL